MQLIIFLKSAERMRLNNGWTDYVSVAFFVAFHFCWHSYNIDYDKHGSVICGKEIQSTNRQRH